MVWLVNMADTDGPKRNSTEAASPQQEAPEGEPDVKVFGQTDGGMFNLVLDWLPFRQCCFVYWFHLFAAVTSPAPSSPSQDDGGFTSSWVSQQEHQLGPLQSTDQTRREIQQMPSARPPVDDDDEESECRETNI